MKPLNADASMAVTKALPASNTTATTDPIDLNTSTNGDFVADCEVLVSIDAVATGLLGDAATHKIEIIHSDNADLSAPTTIAKEVLVQTGAGGAGAAAKENRFRLPTDVKRYIGAKVTKSDNVNASTKNFYLKLLF